jgi:hypothetical protein
MKIESKRSFEPVTITLETPQELEQLMNILRASRGNMESEPRGQSLREDLISRLALQVIP